MRAARTALVGIFLLGQLGGVVHHATTTHERCPEHGELVHGDPSSGRDRASRIAVWADALTRHGAEPPRAREFPTETRHDHDHCTVACTSRERATGSMALQALADVVPTTPRAAGPVVCDPAPALAVYRTAPKTSPPA